MISMWLQKHTFNMKKIKYILLIFIAITFSSCEKYLDINEDPSNPQVAE